MALFIVSFMLVVTYFGDSEAETPRDMLEVERLLVCLYSYGVCCLLVIDLGLSTFLATTLIMSLVILGAFIPLARGVDVIP